MSTESVDFLGYARVGLANVSSFKGKGLAIAVLSFIIPFSSAILFGAVFGLDMIRMIFLGLSVAITALPVAIRILESFNMLDNLIARYSIAGAIINDILALFVLGVILSLPKTRDFGTIFFFSSLVQ